MDKLDSRIVVLKNNGNGTTTITIIKTVEYLNEFAGLFGKDYSPDLVILSGIHADSELLAGQSVDIFAKEVEIYLSDVSAVYKKFAFPSAKAIKRIECKLD